jgi:undecaprenyl-diphosphatase
MSSINLFQSIILGSIEGLTEFLPISSTGHLIIAQKFMGMTEINEFFTVVVQSGAVFAAIFFFWDKITSIFKTHRDKLGYMALGLLPALILGFLFKSQLKYLENSIPIIAFTTIIFGIVFYIIESQYQKLANKQIETASKIDFLIIGFFQSMALIPGVSRSGITITGGTYRKIKIEDSIAISFIMGIPLLLIATLYKIVTVSKGVSSELLINTAVGTLFSFIVGLLGIKLTLGIVQKYGFKPFMIYRIALGLFLLLAMQQNWIR